MSRRGHKGATYPRVTYKDEFNKLQGYVTARKIKNNILVMYDNKDNHLGIAGEQRWVVVNETAGRFFSFKTKKDCYDSLLGQEEVLMKILLDGWV